MLSQPQIHGTLLYFAVAYPIISIVFGGYVKGKKAALWAALAVLLAGFSVKMGYEMMDLTPNHYRTLEVGRHSNTLEIRRSYKSLSKLYHPDKNPDPAAEVTFNKIKIAYDVLMDESQRDCYNRFGEDALAFDPRKDEMKLISDVMVNYVFWIVATYIMTLPVGSRACRTWITIFGILVLSVEVCFCLTETAMPEWMPKALTEFELVYYLHSAFPLVIVCLRCLSEFLYIDVDQTSINVLKELTSHHSTLSGVLQQLHAYVEMSGKKAGKPLDETQLSNIKSKIVELRDQMDQSNEMTMQRIDKLRNSSSNPGANYYWIIFVVMYGGIYFFQ